MAKRRRSHSACRLAGFSFCDLTGTTSSPGVGGFSLSELLPHTRRPLDFVNCCVARYRNAAPGLSIGHSMAVGICRLF